MRDIVERLRERKATWQQAIAVMEDAANEIELLRMERKTWESAYKAACKINAHRDGEQSEPPR